MTVSYRAISGSVYACDGPTKWKVSSAVTPAGRDLERFERARIMAKNQRTPKGRR